MSSDRKRLAIVTGSALALVLTGASIVSAQTPDQNSTGTNGQAPQTVPLQGGPDAQNGAGGQLNGGQLNGGPQGGFGEHGRGPGGRGGDQGGFGGQGGPGGDQGLGMGRGMGIGQDVQDLVSQEVVRMDADGNVLTDRVQHGTVTANADGSLTISLATGDTATIATDANTSAYSWSTTGQPGRTEIAVADVASGADVLVWSESQSDGSFLAQRIAVLPAASASTTPDASPAASAGTVG
ncbi:MAG: hypothetical protein U0869_05740 [Chloroflexota bacterium]